MKQRDVFANGRRAIVSCHLLCYFLLFSSLIAAVMVTDVLNIAPDHSSLQALSVAKVFFQPASLLLLLLPHLPMRRNVTAPRQASVATACSGRDWLPSLVSRWCRDLLDLCRIGVLLSVSSSRDGRSCRNCGLQICWYGWKDECQETTSWRLMEPTLCRQNRLGRWVGFTDVDCWSLLACHCSDCALGDSLRF